MLTPSRLQGYAPLWRTRAHSISCFPSPLTGNCLHQAVRQTVRIVSMDHPQGVLRTGDRATVLFEFISHPEFIKEGMKLLFREGKTKVRFSSLSRCPPTIFRFLFSCSRHAMSAWGSGRLVASACNSSLRPSVCVGSWRYHEDILVATCLLYILGFSRSTVPLGSVILIIYYFVSIARFRRARSWSSGASGLSEFPSIRPTIHTKHPSDGIHPNICGKRKENHEEGRADSALV
jgi:hypothetical protein